MAAPGSEGCRDCLDQPVLGVVGVLERAVLGQVVVLVVGERLGRRVGVARIVDRGVEVEGVGDVRRVGIAPGLEPVPVAGVVEDELSTLYTTSCGRTPQNTT
jgi:hypothetical protein